jgi:hypothetical protein
MRDGTRLRLAVAVSAAGRPGLLASSALPPGARHHRIWKETLHAAPRHSRESAS